MRNLIITYGFEIECEYNKENADFEVGEYHDGFPVEDMEGWTAEEDGSLGDFRAFGENTNTCEFVSETAFGRKQAEELLKDFKRYWINQGYLKLSDCLSFNNTTGAHIHFTPKFKDRYLRFEEQGLFEMYTKAREYFIERLRTSGLRATLTYEIMQSYDRSYATNLIPDDNYKYHGRRREFNFESEEANKGLEWRSPTLRGVKTWEEFFKLYEIYMDTIEHLCELLVKFHIEKEIKPVENLLADVPAQSISEELLIVDLHQISRRMVNTLYVSEITQYNPEIDTIREENLYVQP